MRQSIRDDFFLRNRLHKPLHRTNPHVPNHPHFTHTARLHPLVNPAPAKHGPVGGTEGRGFKSRRSPQNSKNPPKNYVESRLWRAIYSCSSEKILFATADERACRVFGWFPVESAH